MFQRINGITVALVAGLLIGGAFGVGCGDLGDGSCVTDSECSGGETCQKAVTDAVGSCGCTPDPANDPCTASDPATVCHPDALQCQKACNGDSECLTGEKCDPQTKSCRDPSKVDGGDCTQQGQECATDKVCDPTRKACVSPCDASSCATGKVCNPTSKLCEQDCTQEGASCEQGKVCDQNSKLCVASCGSGTCGIDEICGSNGQCQKRCDAPGESCDADNNLVCNTDTGACQIFCDDPASTIECETDEVCSPATHLCIGKCTSDQSCAGGQGFCRKTTGLCETRIDITACPEPTTAQSRTYADTETNRCEPASKLVPPTCTRAAGRDAANTDVAAGPTAFNAKFVRYENASDAACTGRRAIVQIGYFDYQSDFPTDPATQGSALNFSVRVAIGSSGTTANDDFANSQPHVVPGSTAQTGVLEFTLCRANATAGEDFAVYLRDKNQHFGNTICFSVPAP